MDSDISSNHEVFPLRDLTSHLESVCEIGVVSTTVIQRFDNLQTGIFCQMGNEFKLRSCDVSILGRFDYTFNPKCTQYTKVSLEVKAIAAKCGQ